VSQSISVQVELFMFVWVSSQVFFAQRSYEPMTEIFSLIQHVVCTLLPSRLLQVCIRNQLIRIPLQCQLLLTVRCHPSGFCNTWLTLWKIVQSWISIASQLFFTYRIWKCMFLSHPMMAETAHIPLSVSGKKWYYPAFLVWSLHGGGSECFKFA